MSWSRRTWSISVMMVVVVVKRILFSSRSELVIISRPESDHGLEKRESCEIIVSLVTGRTREYLHNYWSPTFYCNVTAAPLYVVAASFALVHFKVFNALPAINASNSVFRDIFQPNRYTPQNTAPLPNAAPTS